MACDCGTPWTLLLTFWDYWVLGHPKTEYRLSRCYRREGYCIFEFLSRTDSIKPSLQKNPCRSEGSLFRLFRDICHQHCGILLISVVILYNIYSYRSAQEKSFFIFAFCRGTPLARNIFFFAEKNKTDLFRRGFSPRNFAEKLPDISRINSANFAEKLCSHNQE